MRSLVSGCAAAALMLGLANAAHAEIVVRDAPVHAVPADDPADDEDVAAPSPAEVQAADTPKPEPAAVQALVHAKPAPAPALTPDETAFFEALGQRVTDAASAYESYVRRAGGIDPAFSGSGSLRKALTASEAYQPRQLEEGIVAYAALVALRNPAFVDGVRGVHDANFLDSLVGAPEQVMRLPGAADAAADIAGVLRAQGEALIQSGKAISKAAYDIQAQGWSKGAESDPQAILAAAKTSADETRAATVHSKQKLLASLVAAPPTPTPASAVTPDVVRGLALAALAISGRTGDGQEQAFEALLRDPAGVDCLKMAKLNLNQCLAVAGPRYEDVYCVGRHAVSDTGKCVTTAAGADAPAPPAAAPPPQQQAAGYGREEAEAYGKPSPPDPEPDDVAQPAPRYAEAPPPAAAPAQPPQQSDAQGEPTAPPPYQAQQQYAQAYPQPSPQYQQPQYQGGYPQRPSYPAQAYPPPNTYPGQSYYQPYGYAARGYYDGR